MLCFCSVYDNVEIYGLKVVGKMLHFAVSSEIYLRIWLAVTSVSYSFSNQDNSCNSYTYLEIQ